MSNWTTMFSSGVSPVTARAGCAAFGNLALPSSRPGQIQIEDPDGNPIELFEPARRREALRQGNN